MYDIILRNEIPKTHARLLPYLSLLLPDLARRDPRRSSGTSRPPVSLGSSQGPGQMSLSTQPGELDLQKRQWEDFESRERLKESMHTTSDGWFPAVNKLWAAAQEMHREAYCQWMESARQSGEMTPAKADALCPFDSR